MNKKYKSFWGKIINMALLCCCICLPSIIIFKMCEIDYTQPQSVVSIKTQSGNVVFRLNQDITFKDDLVTKLSSKIDIVTDSNGHFGELVKVTSKSVMFNYIVNDEAFYLSAINQNIKQISQNEYVCSAGVTNINNTIALLTFRDNVNSGLNDYQNSTVQLTSSLSVTGEWTPIGVGGKPFRGTFDGCGFKVSYSLNSSSYDAGGFFGFVENATIRGLCVENASILGSYTNGVGCLAGNAKNTNIKECWIDESCSINISPATITDSEHSIFKEETGIIGGVVGKYSVDNDNTYLLENCESCVTIEFNFPSTYHQTGRSLVMGGVVGACYGEKGKIIIDKCLFTGKLTASGNEVFAFYMANIVGSAKETGLTVSNCGYKSNLNHSAITMRTEILPIGFNPQTRVYASSIKPIGKYVDEVCSPCGWLCPRYVYGMRANLEGSSFRYLVASSDGKYDKMTKQYYASGYTWTFDATIAVLSNNRTLPE